MHPKAILFDIDGTLLRAGVMRNIFASLFDEIYQTHYPYPDRISFVGATDAALIRQLATESNVPSDSHTEQLFFDAISTRVDEALARKPPQVFNGVPKLLETLSSKFSLGLVTGNSEGAAWAKLRHGRIDHYFSFGAYGSDHPDRNEIARLAQSRFNGEVVALCGDTPLDIEAAHAIGAKAVAVMTGWCTREELCGADVILEDFTDLPCALSAFGY